MVTNNRRSAHRHTKHVCRCCGKHRAIFHFRGHWRCRADHDLCPRCWRAAIDRSRAAKMTRRTAPIAVAIGA